MTPSAALAQRTLEPLLGSVTVAPPSTSMVSLAPLAPLPDNIGPDTLATDPVALVQFVERNPGRLDVEKMDPALVLTLSQVLLRADRTFLAEKLLADAHAKWPERVDVMRGWARVLVSIGRPTVAREALQKGVIAAPEDATMQYLLGRACIGQTPQSAANDACAKAAFEAVLRISPTYQDADGVTAQDLRGILRKLASAAK